MPQDLRDYTQLSIDKTWATACQLANESFDVEWKKLNDKLEIMKEDAGYAKEDVERIEMEKEQFVGKIDMLEHNSSTIDEKYQELFNSL